MGDKLHNVIKKIVMIKNNTLSPYYASFQERYGPSDTNIQLAIGMRCVSFCCIYVRTVCIFVCVQRRTYASTAIDCCRHEATYVAIRTFPLYICQAGLAELPGWTAERRRKPCNQLVDKPRYCDRRKIMMDISNRTRRGEKDRKTEGNRGKQRETERNREK